MRCVVCGMEYGLTHNCPGTVSSTEPEAAAPPPGFAALHYFRLGMAIAKLEEAAIQRAAQDPRAFWYGLLFFWIASLPVLVLTLARSTPSDTPLRVPVIIIGAFLLLIVATLWQLAYVGICHFLVKKMLGGTATYMQVIRPMLVSSFLQILALVPLVGLLLAGAWWGIGVLLWVFEEIHHVDRLRTLAIVVAMNLAVFFLQAYFGLR